MKQWKKAFALTLLTALPITAYSAVCTNTWTGTANDGAWSNAMNWDNLCIPGNNPPVTGLDNATFTTQIGTDYTISLDTTPAISPGLNQMTIQNPTSSYTFLTATTNTIYFNGTTSLLQQIDPDGSTDVTTFQCPIQLNTGTLTIDITSSTAGITINKGMSDGGTSSLSLTGPGTFTNSCVSTTENSDIVLNGNISAVNTQVVNTNNQVGSSTADNATLTAANITFTGSTVTLFNSGGNTLSNNNSSIVATGPLTFNNCTWINTNTGNIDSSTGGAGTLANSTTNNIILNNTTVIAENTGNITSSALSAIGVQLSTHSLTNPFIMTGGSWTATNTGTITGTGSGIASGFLLEAVAGFTMSNTSLTLNNLGAISASGSGGGTGVAFAATGTSTLTNTALNFLNQGDISSTSSYIAQGVLFGNNTLTIVGGTLTATNNGTLNGAIGTNILQTTLTMNNSSWSIVNNGLVMEGGMGNLVKITNTPVINNTPITITNNVTPLGTGIGNMWGNSATNLIWNNSTFAISDTSNSTTGTGNLVAFNNLTINGGEITNNNSGQIQGPAFGSLIKGNSITINGGTLVNNANVQTSTINVAPNGTLAGTGHFQGPTVVTNSGTVTPGQPGVGADPGIMTLNGTYIQTPTGIFLVNIDDPNHFSQLNVRAGGTARLAGTVEIGHSKNENIQVGYGYEIITTDGGVSGTFSKVKVEIPNVNAKLHYFPTTVVLTLDPTASTLTNLTLPIINTVNETNVRIGREMEGLRKRIYCPWMADMSPSEPVALVFTPLAELGLTVDNTEILAQSPQVQNKQQQLTREVSDQNQKDPEDPPEIRPWNFYMGPTGEVGNVLTKKSITGYHFDSIGALAGFDYAFSEVGVGLLLDYNHFHARVAHHLGKFNINEAHASFYTTYVPPSVPSLSVNGILGGGYNWYENQRNISIGTLVAKSNTRGGEFDALIGLEYIISKSNVDEFPDQLQLVPLFSLQYIYVNIGHYKEKPAGGFQLKFKSQQAQSLRSTLGTRINYSWITCCGDTVFTPEFLFAWQREFLDHSRDINFTPAAFALPTSHLQVPQAGRNIALGGFDLLVTFYEKYGVEASYDFEWSKDYHVHYFYVGCNFKF